MDVDNKKPNKGLRKLSVRSKYRRRKDYIFQKNFIKMLNIWSENVSQNTKVYFEYQLHSEGSTTRYCSR